MKTRDLFLYFKYEKAAHPEHVFPRGTNMRVIRRTAENLRKMLKRHGIRWKVITTEKRIIVEREPK